MGPNKLFHLISYFHQFVQYEYQIRLRKNGLNRGPIAPCLATRIPASFDPKSAFRRPFFEFPQSFQPEKPPAMRSFRLNQESEFSVQNTQIKKELKKLFFHILYLTWTLLPKLYQLI